MTKQLTSASIYHIPTDRGLYHVILERIKNDSNGNPRYSAFISTSTGDIAYHYNFCGHYCGDVIEAEWIVKYHLELLGL